MPRISPKLCYGYFFLNGHQRHLIFQWFGLLFVVAGIKNKGKTEMDITRWNKKGKILAFCFCLKRQFVPSINCVLLLMSQGKLVTACSAGQIEGISIHLGCDTYPESRLGIVLSPGHTLHVDRCHIFADLYTSNREWGQFLLFYNLPVILHYPRYALSLPQSHQHWASTRQPLKMRK